MAQSILSATAILLAVGLASAQPAPKVIDLQPKLILINPSAVRSLEEAVEVLEAQLVTKLAYLKAAEAKADRDTAAAMIEVRRAELNEVAVKLKHAKRRLEDAKR